MRTTGAGESALLLLDVVELLREEGVAYAVIGALAASVHGAVRASMDADIVLSAGLATARNLERRFELAGFTTALTQGAFDDPIPGLLRVNDSHDNRVDLLIGVRGLEKDAFSRAIDVPFQGVTLKFIGREDFIGMKAFAGRPTDLQDAARAISADRGSLDLALLRRLAHKFGRDAADALDRLLAK